MKRLLKLTVVFLLLISLVCGCEPVVIDPSSTAARPEESPLIKDDDKEITGLRVNYETEPSCVEGSPVFSWIYNTSERDLVQTNYRIRLAKSIEDLNSGRLVWDSGSVESDRSFGIEYDGNDILSEATKYYWDVTVNTNKGRSFTGGPSYFSTALTDTGFEGASWIRDDAGNVDIGNGYWIWLLNKDAQGSVPVKTEYFKYSFKVSKNIKSAFCVFTADDHGELYINGKTAVTIEKATDAWQNAQSADVTELIVKGNNLIAARAVNTEVGYGAIIAAIKIEYDDGSSEYVTTDGTWYGSDKKQSSGWESSSDTGGFTMVNFKTAYGNGPWYSNVRISSLNSAPMVRGEFNVDGKVKSAFLFASAAGLYNAYINGVKVDNSVLNPGRSEYQTRIMYQSFEVTDLLKDGANAVGAVLGRGWYIGAYSPYGGTNPAFICKLVIDYADGRRVFYQTDDSWLFTADGPVLYDDIFNGETYDARLEKDGWALPGADLSGWNKVSVTDEAALGVGALVPQLSGTVTVKKTLTAGSFSKVDTNTYIYDFGQNLAGVPSITVKGSKGTEVVLRHAEMLNDGSAGSDGKKGTLYTANLRSALATDKYILKGDAAGETYTPSFTFHGFRYLEISGLKDPLPLENVKALVLYSDLEETGRIETSDELINKLFLNTLWGQRGNFLSTPTDCPQRDERMGWSGDAQIFCGTAAYNMNVKQFFDKYITDLNDCQHGDGSYPDVAPGTWRANYSGSGNNAWGDAGVIIPWIMYTRYGDISYIVKYYDNMTRYSKYLLNTSPNHLRSVSAYGDWLSIDESTPVGVTDTAYCIRVFDILANMARLLGKDQDAAKFEDHAAKYRTSWIENYVRKEGRLKHDTQTAYLVALAFDILPEDQRAAMAERLNTKIVKRGTLTTGFIGCSLLLPVLCEFGYTDTAFMLLQQTEYPSWNYPILQGATTIWERWNSYTLENGFGDAGMNSFNHYSYGSVTEWLYSSLCGIGNFEDSPAFSVIKLSPTVGGNLIYAQGEYNSINGLIKSSWNALNNKMTVYKCTVPGNTKAILTLKAEALGDVKEGGIALEEAEGVKVVSFQNGILTLELGSGEYYFTIGG